MANFTVTVYTGITIVRQFERMIILKCDEAVCIMLTLLKGQGHEIRMA